jgi:SAM-dependent methyltransferase
VTAASAFVGPIWRWFERPHRFVYTEPAIGRPGARILDVGCGNHSPSLTRRYYPDATYHAVDRSFDWNLDDADKAAIDRFFEADLDAAGALAGPADRAYDTVLCSHVLEHVRNPKAVAAALAEKVAPGGALYVEVPSLRSVSFPSAREGWFGIRGCLNFRDDPTHREPVDLRSVVPVLQGAGLAVSPVRTRRLARRIALLPAYVGAGLALRGYVPASVIWDAVGFAEYVVGRRT